MFRKNWVTKNFSSLFSKLFISRWLNVKHWLTVQTYEQIEVISNDQWRRFWVWLKDSNLRIYNDYLDINPHLTISNLIIN